MLAIGLSALAALLLAFTHKKRGEALLAEAATETSAELATALREKSEKETKKSKFWFGFAGLAAVLLVAFGISLASM